MNRHGSCFGSNNCSKRVVISVFIHFFSCGFGRVWRSASTGDAPFLGVPKSPVFGPASPVLGWQIPSLLHFFRFLLHRFCVFLHDFCIFSHFFCQIFCLRKRKLADFGSLPRAAPSASPRAT